jgi:hypothetical protein
MTDEVKKAETLVEAKEEAASEPEADAPAETFTAAAVATAHGVVAATDPKHIAKPEAVPGAPEGTVSMHPSKAAILVVSEFVQTCMMQGVHPVQAASYAVTAALSLLRQLGLSGKDVNDLVIHFNQTWRLMTETKDQKPN